MTIDADDDFRSQLQDSPRASLHSDFQGREFCKYEALGNDYIVIDPHYFVFEPTPEAVSLICDRNRGVGSDGILWGPLQDFPDAPNAPHAPSPHNEDNENKENKENNIPFLCIFNPDGSEAEKSGNGLRIFSLYLAEHGYVKPEAFSIRTRGGVVRAGIDSFDPPLIWVDMGEPSFSAKAAGLRTDKEEFIRSVLPLPSTLPAAVEANFVSMGNPHCVVFVDEPSESLARSLGPVIEHNVLFPNRTNVQFAKVLDSRTLRIQIWERGAGYTLASGTSACAAAAVARKLGLIEPSRKVSVIMPGGTLTLDLSKPSITLIGPARNVFNGLFSESTKRLLASMEVLADLGPVETEKA
ncbi:MAG TPA: diaminopimelate epimerase [Spirochaetales bacterium]|nr:diaminopimelate epimerase [Spirochaetales bacterium]